MRSARAILSVKYTPISATARRAVAGFLRYIQYGDHHDLDERRTGIERLTRYVAYRDSASPQGRLFNERDTVADVERRALAAYVRRSTAHVNPQRGAPARAVYRLVLSPEDARGLDLRAVARATMHQLSGDAKGLPQWIAAEHRNTAHPHVHIVLPAWRETEPGTYRQLVITKARLASMKGAMSREIAHQHGLELGSNPRRQSADRRYPAQQWPHGPRRRRHQSTRIRSDAYRPGSLLKKIAERYRRQVERQQAQLEREREHDRRLGRGRGD